MSKTKSFILAAIFSIAGCFQAEACTGIKLTAQDDSVVHGRTLEFGIQLNPSIVFVPRNYEFKSYTPQGEGLTYKSKYAAIGAMLFDDVSIMDGINEKGLAVGTFFFPGFAKYTDVNNTTKSKAVSPIEFPNWIITQFATLDEVKQALPNIIIAPTANKNWGNITPPFHYIVYDANGNSLVIEPINGKLVTHDNPLGVLTNSPDFDWHMKNLRNYINLRAVNVPPIRVENLELAPYGQGSGMVGLPGDFTPPSRFVRASTYVTTAIPSKDAEEAVFQAFHILNQFDIPIGVSREKDSNVIHTDYTMVTSVKDPKALKYYYKTYDDQNIKMLDLNKYDLDSKTIKTASTASKPRFWIDVTASLK